MNKRSATMLAVGVAIALMATAFALSVTARPTASAKGAVHALVPRVRTITTTVKVHRTRDVPIVVPGAPLSSSAGQTVGNGAGEHEGTFEPDHHEGESEGFEDHGGESAEGGFDD